jgi:hypothetical protein
MIYATPDALTGHASAATYPTLGGGGATIWSKWVVNTTNVSQEEIG